MIKDLVPKNDPILRNPCARFDFSNPPVDPQKLYTDLAETLIERKGLGLAANQIGYPYQVFVIWSDPMMVLFNPVIVDVSEETTVLEEGCLSFPGIYVKVRRPSVIKVRYTHMNGETVTRKFQDMTARVIQHEMEHLSGELFTKHATRLQLALAIKKASKKKHRYIIGDLT